MSFITCFALCIQTTQLARDLSMSMMRIVLLSAALTLCNVSFHIFIAEMWVFPIPFGYVWGAVPFGIFLGSLFVCAVGRQQLRTKPNLTGQPWKQSIVVIVQILLCLVYPAYNAIYLRLGPWQKTIFVFVLPLIKFVLQNIVAWSTKHIVEYMPGVTVLTIEVFNGLYLAKCMQSAGSNSTFMAIMVFDVFESTLAYRDLEAQARYIYRRMAIYNSATHSKRGFVETLVVMCQDSDVFSRKDTNIRIRSPIMLHVYRSASIIEKLDRMHSFAMKSNAVTSIAVGGNTREKRNGFRVVTTVNVGSFIKTVSRLKDWYFAHSMDQNKIHDSKLAAGNIDMGREPLKSLSPPTGPSPAATFGISTNFLHSIVEANEIQGNTNQNDVNSNPNSYQEDKLNPQSRTGSVHYLIPTTQAKELRKFTIPSATSMKTSDLTPDEKLEVVDLSLKVLFQCEYYALVEYVEAMVPMLYGIYVAMLSHLPSRAYYPETRHMVSSDANKMVLNIFAYAWLEIISFVVLQYFIKRKCGFSPAYLLAFVLENQAIEFQARLLVWFSYILDITLVHFGVDLLLKFAWLKGDWSGM